MPLLIVLTGILLLLVLMLVFKVNSFIAFAIVSIGVGLAERMPIDKVIISIEKGIGDTLGYLVLILGLGAMLGKLVSDSGAAQKVTSRLVHAFGIKRVQWAVMLTGFIIGVPLFYDVGFVIMIPLVFTIAFATGLPLLYVGLPMLASLSVTHGYLPPHPAPTAIALMFGADIGKTLIYGLIIAIPAIIVAGPGYARFLKKIKARPLKDFVNRKELTEEEMPSLATSILTALLPVILIGLSTFANFILPQGSWIRSTLNFTGQPVMAMLIAVLVAVYTLGIARGRKIGELMESMASSVSSLTMVLLIIAGAGALKQVMVDGGVSAYIGELLSESTLSPLIMAWLIATLLRVSVGSATVAGITTAGIVLPMVAHTNVKPELLVLAIGSGSIMLAHVNDGGFWLVKEYFSLSIKETLKTWTVMETTIGVVGLIGVLILNLFV